MATPHTGNSDHRVRGPVRSAFGLRGVALLGAAPHSAGPAVRTVAAPRGRRGQGPGHRARPPPTGGAPRPGGTGPAWQRDHGPATRARLRGTAAAWRQGRSLAARAQPGGTGAASRHGRSVAARARPSGTGAAWRHGRGLAARARLRGTAAAWWHGRDLATRARPGGTGAAAARSAGRGCRDRPAPPRRGRPSADRRWSPERPGRLGGLGDERLRERRVLADGHGVLGTVDAAFQHHVTA